MKVNKIYLGDSYELIKEIPDKSIDCIYTDVPYLYGGGAGAGAGAGASELTLTIRKAQKELEDADIISGFDYSILDEFVRVMKKVNIIIWFSKLQMQYILNYFLNLEGKEINFEPLIWKKTNPTPMTNNTWLPDLEYAFHFREKGVRVNDGYHIKNKGYVSQKNVKDKDLYDHPTIKPLECVTNHILHITKENDIVLDPFLGSGTTVEACIKTKRKYIGIEKSETYYKIATDRENGLTQVEVREKEMGIQNIFELIGE